MFLAFYSTDNILENTIILRTHFGINFHNQRHQIIFYCLGFVIKHLRGFSVLLSELPKPNLGDLSEIKLLKTKLRRTKNPNVLGYTYSELLDLDKVEVELEPDKKGLILKHREYTVSSRVRLPFLFFNFSHVGMTKNRFVLLLKLLKNFFVLISIIKGA